MLSRITKLENALLQQCINAGMNKLGKEAIEYFFLKESNQVEIFFGDNTEHFYSDEIPTVRDLQNIIMNLCIDYFSSDIYKTCFSLKTYVERHYEDNPLIFSEKEEIDYMESKEMINSHLFLVHNGHIYKKYGGLLTHPDRKFVKLISTP